MPQLEHAGLTDRVIAAAIEVHRRLGPGFRESIYENALVIELRRRGTAVARQVDVPVLYEGQEVGRHRLDLLVGGTIIVELKAVSRIEDIRLAVAKSYLRATGRQHGLILNFARSTLEIRRVFCR